LQLWEKTPGLAALRYSTDAFFCYGINAICGSAVIDIPLAAYRIHGKNGFAARLPLNCVRGYDIDSRAERSLDALSLLIREAQRNRFYRQLFWRRSQFRAMLSYLRGCHSNVKLNNLSERSLAGWFKKPSALPAPPQVFIEAVGAQVRANTFLGRDYRRDGASVTELKTTAAQTSSLR
jgi:hypothetical protein